MTSAGIYISIPYCRQKCTYCNFASAARPMTELPQYLQTLESEIRHCRELWTLAGLSAHENLNADSIYMGGGTPSLLMAPQMASLLHAVRTTFEIVPESEITVEASPENVTAERAEAWAACGINRVSLGVQSMVTKELRAVGRMHDAGTVANAAANLRRAGIENISLDLIAGLPHQTAESFRATLARMVELEPTHLSVYMLEVDQDSSLGGELLAGGSRYGASAVPTDELVVELYTHAVQRLAASGYLHYEISNFARPGYASSLNMKYWTNIPYFGFGVDAHSYDGAHRWANVDSITDYLERMNQSASPTQGAKQLSTVEKLEERFFLGLRRRGGINLAEIYSEFGETARESYQGKIRELCAAGWLETDAECLRLTDRGVLFSNDVFSEFLAQHVTVGLIG